jgi:hypothetical protein
MNKKSILKKEMKIDKKLYIYLRHHDSIYSPEIVIVHLQFILFDHSRVADLRRINPNQMGIKLTSKNREEGVEFFKKIYKTIYYRPGLYVLKYCMPHSFGRGTVK